MFILCVTIKIRYLGILGKELQGLVVAINVSVCLSVEAGSCFCASWYSGTIRTHSVIPCRYVPQTGIGNAEEFWICEFCPDAFF